MSSPHTLRLHGIPVDEDIVEVEFEDEIDQLLLHLLVRLLPTVRASVLAEQAERVH